MTKIFLSCGKMIYVPFFPQEKNKDWKNTSNLLVVWDFTDPFPFPFCCSHDCGFSKVIGYMGQLGRTGHLFGVLPRHLWSKQICCKAAHQELQKHCSASPQGNVHLSPPPAHLLLSPGYKSLVQLRWHKTDYTL